LVHRHELAPVLSRRADRLFAFLLLLLAGPAVASGLFSEHSIVDVGLTGPLSTVIDGRKGDPGHSFELTTAGRSQPVTVSLRGRSRLRLCSFPPLRLEFEANADGESEFAGVDGLKLVTHCRAGKRAQQDLLEEYAAYRMFALLSDASYRVRLLDISYTDTDIEGNGRELSRMGFVVEPKDAFVERVSGARVDATAVSLRSLNERQAALVYVFQFLIGNTDWSLVMADDDDRCCHNIDLFDIDGLRFIVPYDFDLSGIVNARYAHPLPEMKISRVTQRRYRGYCIATEALLGALREIKARREDILEVLAQIPGFPSKEAAVKRNYLDRFFDQAEDEARMIRKFEAGCL